ncbi:hypothetical protein GGI02_004707, partial [Coemansia sp. RSA 2322]
MVSLANTAALLALVLTASCQIAHAAPNAQIQGSIVPKATSAASTHAPTAGEGCNVDVDRIVCANSSSLLVCNNNEWVQFSNCNLGTVCRDGNCVYPDGTGNSASSPAAKPAASAAPSQPANPAGSAAAVTTNSSPSSGVANPASSAAQVATAKPTASQSGTAQASSSSAAGGNNSGSGGNNFGITCDKFNKAVSAASSAIGNNYPVPSSAQCNSFLKGMVSAGSIASAREAAMFFANILWESDGLRAKEEYDCLTLPTWCAQNYATPEDVPGQTYWGRGYIQLTWHYNYLAASEGLYGDDRLAKNTAQVATNEDIAWNVSFWFWKNNVRTDPGVQAGDFGSSINQIN